MLGLVYKANPNGRGIDIHSCQGPTTCGGIGSFSIFYMLYGCMIHVPQIRSRCLNGILVFDSVLRLTYCACPLWCVSQSCGLKPPSVGVITRINAPALRSTFALCSHTTKIKKLTCTDGDVATPAGLILADSANMVMRIGYSWHFIKSDVPGLRLTAWAPSFVSCCAATAAAVALRKC